MVEKWVAVVARRWVAVLWWRGGAWWVAVVERGVWLVERWWAAVVEREVLGWWGGVEEGVAGGNGVVERMWRLR